MITINTSTRLSDKNIVKHGLAIHRKQRVIQRQLQPVCTVTTVFCYLQMLMLLSVTLLYGSVDQDYNEAKSPKILTDVIMIHNDNNDTFLCSAFQGT